MKHLAPTIGVHVRPALAALAVTAPLLLSGCGANGASAPGHGDTTPISTGALNPPITTRPVPASPTPAAPGTAVVLQDHEYSYTPAGTTSPQGFQPLASNHPTLTVARGTIVELRLTPGSFAPPTSSHPQILTPRAVTWTTTTADARFTAAQAGSSVLTATAPPCPGTVACTTTYTVTVAVTDPSR